jgi:hypothetical protein
LLTLKGWARCESSNPRHQVRYEHHHCGECSFTRWKRGVPNGKDLAEG